MWASAPTKNTIQDFIGGIIMNDLFDRAMQNIKEGAEIVVDAAQEAVQAIKTSVKKSVDVSTLNTKISRISLEISTEFMQIGEMVYKTHKDPDSSAGDLQAKIDRIDELYKDMDSVKAERERRTKDDVCRL
jgi:hypothetical protein